MSSYIKSRHDIGLLRTDGTTQVGFMLAKRNGVPQYKRYDAEPLSEQRAQGEPGYGWFPPGEELPIILDDFSGGLSQEIYSSSSPTKYFTAYNMDCRFGQPIAGLKAETLTKPVMPTAPTITNGDMELTTGWTNGSRSSAIASHGGTYEWLCGGGVTAYQDLTVSEWTRYTVTGWLNATGVAGGRLGLEERTTGKKIWTTSETGSSWVEYSLTILVRDKTTLRINLEGACYFDDVTIATASANGVSKASADFNSNYYRSFGSVLGKLNTSTGTSFTYIADLPAVISSLEVNKDGFLYIGQEASQVIENCEDVWSQPANWTTSLDTDDYKVGSGSVKFVIDATAAAGTFAYEDITQLNLSDYNGVKLWIKCSVATASGDFKLLLDNTSACASPVKTINIPALTANQWTQVFLYSAYAAGVGEIISVGLEYDVDIGACTVWIDDIEAEHTYLYMNSGESFTVTTAGDVGEDSFAKFLKLNGTTLWKSLPPHRVYSCTDGTDPTTWTTPYNVDSPDKDINALVSMSNTLYIPKEDRPFYMDSTPAVQVLADDTKAIQTSDSGKNSITWHGDLFMPYGTASLLKYDGTDTSWIDPALYCKNLGDFDGQVQGLAGDDQFLYAVVDNGTKVEVLSGESGWVWHGSLTEITLTGCEHASITSVYKKRLYISSTVAGESLYYVNLYANYGDVTNDDNRNFPNNAELHTPKLHGGFKGDTKAFIKVSAELGHTYDVDIYFECHYQIQGDTTWTDAGDFKGTSGNRKATLFIPADSSSNNPKSEWIRFKLIEKTDDVTKTPILVNLDVRSILYITKRRLIECVIRGCDKPNDDSITAAMIKTVLLEADDATWPVTFYPWGWLSSSDTVYVNFLSCQEVVEMDEESRQPESHWYLRLQEVALS